MQSVLEQKQLLRKQMRAVRKNLNADLRAQWSQKITQRVLQLPELQAVHTVFCYISYGAEVATQELVQQLLHRGKTVCVPRCKEEGQMDLVPITCMEQLQPGMYGILEPPKEAPSMAITSTDFAILPAIACGRDGSRMGQGGGYYDRFLQKYTGRHCVLCFEACLQDRIPVETHDQLMQCIVTEQQVITI